MRGRVGIGDELFSVKGLEVFGMDSGCGDQKSLGLAEETHQKGGRRKNYTRQKEC